LLIEICGAVGVPSTNSFINADTPMAGHTELQELAHMCNGLKFPERITSHHLRTYIATVS